MNTRILLVLGLAILAVTEISAKCACHLAGRDMCSCSGHVVRPVKPVKFDHAKPKTICHTIPGVEKLKPVGDTCSCGHQIVSPAIVPRTPCAKHAFPIVHHLGKPCGDVVRAPEEFQHFHHDHHHHHGHHHHHDSVYGTEYDVYKGAAKKAALPADAVSLGLALKLANSAARSVGEERLAYGFKKLPEVPKVEEVKDIPEERLFTCDRQIVELKVPKIQQFQHEDMEEYLEEEEESEPVINTLLTYSDLGYAPEKVHHSEFILRPPHEREDVIPEPHHVGNCGLQLGNVIVKDHHHYDAHHHHYDSHHHSYDSHHHYGHKHDSFIPGSDERHHHKSEEDPFGLPGSAEWKHEDGIFLQKLKPVRYH